MGSLHEEPGQGISICGETGLDLLCLRQTELIEENNLQLFWRSHIKFMARCIVATDFGDIEAAMAKGFAESAQRQNVQQIIYLGGIANDENRSRHLTLFRSESVRSA